ncbi:hypothetical protein ACOMHN_017978 [Nucella lapillus]
MKNEDDVGSSLNSTDTSQFLRELEALNASPSESDVPLYLLLPLRFYVEFCVHNFVVGYSRGGSGDATITQLMNTMYSSQSKQKIVFMDKEGEGSNVGVYGREVDIFLTPLEEEESPRAGSNKVKIKPVVQHMWDQRYYHGNLVAVHQDGEFVAFSIKTKSACAIRVMHNTSSDRKLIRGFTGSVVDVAFAHSSEVIVAGVDDLGTLLVYACKLDQQGDIVPTPLLHIEQGESSDCAYNRVVWCPYWPEEGEESESEVQDSSKVLACTHHGQIDLFAVDVVTRDCGPGPLNQADIESGRITLVPHDQPIVEAVFSPDGSALASASTDGDVKFFQINWVVDSSECLHEWKPHEGKPLSFFAFLDDLKNMSPDAQFWKFAVTGCNKNQELKVWSCETWNCLQTIRFVSPPVGPEQDAIVMKAGLDLSARYILLSDKTNMMLYVMQVYQDALTSRAHVSSVARFPLTQPCLSFAIIDASTKKFRTSLNDSHLDDITTGEVDREDEDQTQNMGDEEEGEAMIGVQIRLYAIHPRALQKLVIHYRPESTVPIQGSAASLSHDTISLRDGLSDVSVGGETSFVESEGTVENAGEEEERVPPQPQQITSPDAFTMTASRKLICPSSGPLVSPSGGGGAVGNDTTVGTEDVMSLCHFTVSRAPNILDCLQEADLPLIGRVGVAIRGRGGKLISPSSGGLASPSGGATGSNTTVVTEDVMSSTSSFTHVTGLTGQNAEDLLLSPASYADYSTAADHSASAPPAPTVLSPQSIPDTSPKSQGSVLSPKSQGSVLSPKSQGSVLSPTSTLSPKSPLYSTPQQQQGERMEDDLTPSSVPLPPEEEGELVTPHTSYISEDGSQLDALEAFFKPNTSTSSQHEGDTSVNTGTFSVETLAPQSPVAAPGATPGQGPATTADAYDENDQEVAEVLGEDMEQTYSSTSSATGVTAPADYAGGVTAPAADYTTPQAAEEEDERPHKPWPRPPDVPTADQPGAALTQPLPPQAMDEAVSTQEPVDGEDDDSEDQNEAEVEEEIEEVLEEAEDDDDEEEEEGEDLRKTYRGVQEGARGPAGVKVVREVVDPGLLAELHQSIQNLSLEVSRQQQHMCRLQQQMAEQHEVQVDLQRQQLEQASLRSAAQPTKDLEQQLGRVQNVVASRVERALSTTLQKENILWRLTSSESRQSAYLESLQKAVTQTLTASIHGSMETLIRNEFRQSVTPVITKATEQMKNQLHTDTSQKLAAMETVVKDQICKLVRSRQTTDAIGQAASTALYSQGQSVMREVVENRIIPSFTLITDNMLTQMNAIFQQGTTEYFNHLRKQLDKVRQEQEAGREPVVQQLTSAVDSFHQHSQHLHQQLAQAVRHEVSHQIKTSLASFQEQVSASLRSTVREEVGVALKEQGSKMTDSLASYLRSGAATPVHPPHTPDPTSLLAMQDQVKQLVSRGRLDKAFQLALSASNLELVLFVCELVDPGVVFGVTPCLLSQPVLLSLVQQLSADLASSFNIKVKYLTEAVTTLDAKDPVTQEHIPVVLEGLAAKLRAYMASHPPNRDIKLLLMATTSLLSSTAQ